MKNPVVFNLDNFLEGKANEGDFYAVLGRPISHSLSPLIHNFALQKSGINAKYYPLVVHEEYEHMLSKLFRHPNFRGANVTIPLKQLVSNLVDESSENVKRIGAVNTVYRNRDYTLCAENTDIYGFLSPLLQYKSDLVGESALIFGSGGASKAVIYALKSLGMSELYVASRNPEKLNGLDYKPISYSDWAKIAPSCMLIVNSSPVGMFPKVDGSLVDEKYVSQLKGKICYDLIYRPMMTRFLNQALSQGSTVIGGLDMFIGQAEQAFKLFTNMNFPIDEVRSLLLDYFESENEGI